MHCLVNASDALPQPYPYESWSRAKVDSVAWSYSVGLPVAVSNQSHYALAVIVDHVGDDESMPASSVFPSIGLANAKRKSG